MEHVERLLKDAKDISETLPLIASDYGLKSLQIQPDLHSDHAINCLNKMTRNRQLPQFTQGLSLVIAQHYGVDEGTGQLFLAHNFR